MLSFTSYKIQKIKVLEIMISVVINLLFAMLAPQKGGESSDVSRKKHGVHHKALLYLDVGRAAHECQTNQQQGLNNG